MTRRQVVAVLWEDSCSAAERWVGGDVVDEFAKSGVMCLTVGMLLRQDKRSLTVASSESNQGHHGGLWRIPRAMVRKITRLPAVAVPG